MYRFFSDFQRHSRHTTAGYWVTKMDFGNWEKTDGTFLSLQSKFSGDPKKGAHLVSSTVVFYRLLVSCLWGAWPQAGVNVGTRNCFLHLSSYSNGVICRKKRPTGRNFSIDILEFQRLKTTGYVVLLYFTACSFFMLLPFPLTRVIHLKSLKGFSVTWKLTANHGAISCSHFYYFTSLLRRRAEDVTFPSLFQDLLHDSPMIAEENG